MENIRRRLRRLVDRLYFLYGKRWRRWGYRWQPFRALLDLWRGFTLGAAREDVRMEKRRELLREVLQPVPSRAEVAGRYLTVVAVLWLGLMAGDALLYKAGWCVLECEARGLNATIWALFVIIGGVVTIWNMHQARARHARARQLLLHKGVFMCDVWSGVKLFVALTILLMSLSFAVTAILMLAGFE